MGWNHQLDCGGTFVIINWAEMLEGLTFQLDERVVLKRNFANTTEVHLMCLLQLYT